MTPWLRIANLLPSRRNKLESEMRQELESLQAVGGRREIGSVALAAENARAEWSFPRIETVLRDLRMAMRTLRKSPGYVATCVAVLALGVGANTAMFSVVEAAVLRPLPFPHADRLVHLWQKVPSLPPPIGPRMGVQRAVYEEWQRQSDLFSEVAAYHDTQMDEGGVDRPRTLEVAYASSNLFRLLGASAAHGRLFGPEEDREGSGPVILLSDRYFEARFHRDVSAIGKSITIGKVDYTVIGVMPAKFRLPAIYEGEDEKKPELWIPLSRLWVEPSRPSGPSPGFNTNNEVFQLYVIGMLKPGVGLEQVRTALGALQVRLNKSDPERYVTPDISVYTLAEEAQSTDANLALYMLLGAVGFLLLIGCSNLANLTMARATRRAREISIRRALGASRVRVILQLLSESWLISIAGAGAGLLVAYGIMAATARFPSLIPPSQDLQLNLPVLAFTAAISLLTTMLFGLAPAISASRISLNEALKSRGGGGASAALAKSRYLLIAAQVGLAVILLCGSGLLMRSFSYLIHTGLGFNIAQLTVADVLLPEARYTDGPSRDRFYEQLVAKARSIPGVSVAAVASTLPAHMTTFSTFTFADRPKPKLNESPSADSTNVGVGYFQVMQLPLRAGRDFTEADVAVNLHGKGDGVVVINQAFADKFYKAENRLGRRLLLANDRPFQIVGVATNFLAMGATEPAHPQFFVPGMDAQQGVLLVRTAVPPESMANSIRTAFQSIDPELPLAKVQTMEQLIDEVASDPRTVLILLGIFTGVALALAMVGVYSVLASLVASRTREVGIRMALGATPKAVGRLIAGQSLMAIGGGLVVGLIASVGVGWMLRELLFGVRPADPVTFLLAIGVVALVAPLAIWGPMRRAIRVECTVALREE